MQHRPGRIFISYSHRESQWLDELQKRLRLRFQGESEFCAWDDRAIPPGQPWFGAIADALEAADAAILLVTPDFLNSDFILNVELPRIQWAVDHRGLRLFWIPVKDAGVTQWDHWLAGQQAVSDPSTPLDSLEPHRLNTELVRICSVIHATLEDSTPPPDPAAEVLRPLRTFAVQVRDADACIADESGHLWVTDRHQALMFQPDRDEPVERIPLPPSLRRTKAILDTTWGERVVLSDWDGSLFALRPGRDSSESCLYEAHRADLPLHRLAVSSDGYLVAVAWNGVFRRWTPDAEPLETLTIAPSLPICLLGLPGGAFATADQANTLRLYDPGGTETMQYTAPDALRGLMAWGTWRDGAFVLQVGDCSLMCVQADGRVSGSVVCPAPIVACSQRLGDPSDEWFAVGTRDGAVQWLSLSNFAVCEVAQTPMPIRSLFALYDPQRRASLLGCGLNEGGRIFKVEGSRHSTFEQPEGLTRLCPDPSGRLLLAPTAEGVHVFRNPALGPVPCQIEVLDTRGALKVGTFREVVFICRNAGPTTLLRVQASLEAEGVIRPAQTDPQRPVERVRPGDHFELSVSVQAVISGRVPLTLRLIPTDEAGARAETIVTQVQVESLE